MLKELRITTIQSNLIWEDVEKNLENFKNKIDLIQGSTDIIVLPEMFTTGFSMNPAKFGESMEGHTVSWMKKMASLSKAYILGSIIIKENNNFFNRLLVVSYDGNIQYYDKKHLFAMADENKYYHAGSKKLVFEFEGWKICPLICYDLRFPVWSRNQNNYDLLVYVANWPEKRNHHWKTLLKARAIENQSYVVGVNRIGKDGNNIDYSGDTCVIDPMGHIISTTELHKESIETVIISKNELEHIRKILPFSADADQFLLT